MRGIQYPRSCLLGLMALLWAQAALADEPPSLAERVDERARLLAAAPFETPDGALPEPLARLDARAYHAIGVRQPPWPADSDFRVQALPRGYIYRDRVRIHFVSGGVPRTLPFDPALFDPRPVGLDAAQLPSDLGYAGLRVLYPLNRPDRHDEVLVFLGASYFRLLGRDQGYGLSARGLAIDTALPQGEEFPAFREFWIERPPSPGRELHIHALLDSPSVSGAWHFVLRPGGGTRLEVHARMFARETVTKLGLAPLTSMFMHGENSTRPSDDVRPEVHDSDGLLVHSGHGEPIWRPLTNPRRLQVSALRDDSPRGFGLMQRDRDFASYLAPRQAYERRPSLWVEPLGRWREGAVELVEIPSEAEDNDNIVAYWVPDQGLRAGESLDVRYRLHVRDLPSAGAALGHVVRTRNGWSGADAGPRQDPPPRESRLIAVDFAGGALDTLHAAQPVQAHLASGDAAVSDIRVRKLPGDAGWRASLLLEGRHDRASDLRLFLELRGERLTETWNHVWSASELD